MITKFKLIKESPDLLVLPNGEKVKWREGIAFGYYKNEMKVHPNTHVDMTLDIEGSMEGRGILKYAGRIFVSHQIIAFWQFPDPEKLKQIIKELENILDIIIDENWLIEKNDDKNIFIHPSEYEKHWYGVEQRSEKEMGKAHLDWKLKNELKKKGWGKGWGSDMTAWDGKNPLAWRQAKYQENVMSFDNYFLNENRISDLKQKYITNLGEDLGVELWESDITENKAYSEWLLSFYKKNKKEIDKIKDFPELLQKMIKKYHNNKQNYSKQITQIKTLKEFRSILDEKDNFDEINSLFNKEQVKIWFDDLEWIVFQPFRYEISEYANRKERKTNWCTTYAKSQFDQRGGYKGRLIYCINKLDPTQDVCFELIIGDLIKRWDYKNNSKNLYSVYDMKEEFSDDTEIYKIFDELEHEVELPTYTRSELEQMAKEFYESIEVEPNKDDVFSWADDNNFVETFIEREVDYFKDELAKEFFPQYDRDLNYTFKYIWQVVGIENFCEYFDIPLGIGEEYFWKSEGYPDVERFIQHLETPERLKTLELDENSKWDEEECYELIEEFVDKKGDAQDLVHTHFKHDRYSGYDSKDIFEYYYGDAERCNIKEIISFIGNVDVDDFKEQSIQRIVDNMSDEEIIELVFDN